MYAWFENDSLKTAEGVDYTNFIPYNVKSCEKLLSLKGHNSVKINFIFIETPHAHRERD